MLNIWNNEILDNKVFPQELKLANVTPIFKKDDATLCKNYRPTSVLPSTSKIFERIIQNQLVPFIEKFGLFLHVSPTSLILETYFETLYLGLGLGLDIKLPP